MQKALANGRLPGVLPGAESPANLLIANDPARGFSDAFWSHQSFSNHAREIARD
ncbi:hypothetical protein MTR_1g053560 [Medicago truncatula]|uniref:Uncharacterized protein n=1 Tax=Medicago truncatula TaxID=3880 RepID=A0A072VJ82_MEDTR|nr:hypothetical protein MTR_1g053560 [Medicago truncatula]